MFGLRIVSNTFENKMLRKTKTNKKSKVLLMTPKVFPSRIFRLLFHYPLPLDSPKELFKFILLFLLYNISSVYKMRI